MPAVRRQAVLAFAGRRRIIALREGIGPGGRMDIFLIVVLVVAVALLGYGIATYNRLVRLKNLTQEGWSGIDVQLKRRTNLIPNLVNTVKGYAAHEKSALEEVTRARGAAAEARTPAGVESAANMMTAALGRLFAVAEAYPELKADANFRALQQQLAETEDQIEKARRYYNGTAREQNTLVEQFPSNLVAGMFGFGTAKYFEIVDPSHRAVPEVAF
jgi:LemA protein